MSPSDGASASSLAEQAVFFSGDVARIAGVSARQLQWLDERQVVSPRKEGRRRKYAAQQVLEVLIVSSLRRKGLSLQRLRRVLRLVRRELGQYSEGASAGPSKLYLLTNGDSIHFETQPEGIIDRLIGAKTAMYLVSLSDLSRTITSEKPARRSRTRQLVLF
jgi:DNA-binding transcriptional MerR regulator